jgi:ribosome-associated protein
VKKTTRSTGASGKGPRAKDNTTAPSSARKPGRIPVRGAGKTAKLAKSVSKASKSSGGGKGVRDRIAPVAPTRAPRADLAEVRALALAAIDAALEKKALAPVLIDVSGMASYTDFIGIVSGRSDRQVDAIADSIRQVMKEHGRMTLGHEGRGNGRWTLLDFGSVVVHVFHHPVREFYDLESLWIEAPRVPIDVPAESAISAESDAYYSAL